MVDREVHHRDDKRRAALMKRAGLKYPQACIEDVDSKPGRGFERSSLMSLALSRWVEDGTAILVTGPTGSGKSWLACALAQYACRRGHSALYLRVPRLAEDLRVLHGNGGFGRWLAAVARTDVLLLDDWGLAAMDGPTRADLMEVIDDRARNTPDDRDEPIARRALACVDRRRNRCRRDPRSAAVAQPSPEPQGQVDAAEQGGRCADRRQRHRGTARHRRRIATPPPTTSTREPLNHLQTATSYNPFHATQHRPLKPVTFPKSSVTFAEIRTLSTELTTRSSVVDADAARRRRLLLSCAMCASHHSAASFHQTSHAMSLS